VDISRWDSNSGFIVSGLSKGDEKGVLQDSGVPASTATSILVAPTPTHARAAAFIVAPVVNTSSTKSTFLPFTEEVLACIAF
jgi:hypothetical protein